jgi:hypothetical protein
VAAGQLARLLSPLQRNEAAARFVGRDDRMLSTIDIVERNLSKIVIKFRTGRKFGPGILPTSKALDAHFSGVASEEVLFDW